MQWRIQRSHVQGPTNKNLPLLDINMLYNAPFEALDFFPGEHGPDSSVPTVVCKNF